MSQLGTTVDLKGKNMDEAIVQVTTALQAEGFGVLTEIDVQATLKEKIDVDFRPYRILGACNPKLAHRALSADADVGLLLPCNVVVEAIDGGTRVRLVDPSAMLAGATVNGDVAAVANEAKERLARVAATLGR
jgi:uncharacterized protein (DUF302 family)